MSTFPAPPSARFWPRGGAFLLLLVALFGVAAAGELHLSASVLPDTTANLSAIRRAGLIVWVLLWFLAFAGVLWTLSGRPLFALAAANLTALAIFVLSATKFDYLNAKLLYPDLYFSLRDASEVEFLIGHYPETIVGAALVIGASAALLAAVWRQEGRAHPARIAGLSLSVLAVAAIILIDAFVMPRGLKENVFWRATRDERFFSDLFLSGQFFSKLLATPLALPVAKTVDPALPAEIDAMQAAQRPTARKPHIIAILHESSVDPALYFHGEQFAVPETFFASGDGRRRQLLVNTFGGNTWMSEHGLLLGLDVDFFAGLAPFLAMVGVDQFSNTFAEALKADGYRVVANYISPKTFQNTERFYTSMGFDEVLGPDQLGLAITGQDAPRDRAYYAFTLDQLEREIRDAPDRPTFHMIWTVATHYPYDTPKFPDVRPDEITPGDAPAEFARRQRIAADDLAWFEAELARRFPNQPFLIAGFGDHQPRITRPFVDKDTWRQTYYRIAGVNFDPDYSALAERSSIGFLGEMILGAARLPAPRSFLIRRWIRQHCDGLWFACPDEKAMLSANALLMTGDTAVIRPAR